jgi:hypothetical protein
MKGFRTVITGLGIAVAPVALEYVAKIDWTQYVSPNIALVISGLTMVALRAITSSGIFSK